MSLNSQATLPLRLPAVRILLPPSEGKATPTSPVPFTAERLAFPQLGRARQQVAAALVRLSAQPRKAAAALGLGPTQLPELAANRELWHSPTSPAIELFTGVLFEALDYQSLSAAQRSQADAKLLIFNALTGVATPQDPLPAFRLGGAVVLPKLGNVGAFWQRELASHWQLPADELIVDVRSGTYARFWRPDLGENFVELKVMQLVGSGRQQRKVAVSHFNKATKGRLVRELLTGRSEPREVAAVASRLAARGWDVELLPARGKRARVLEVMISRTSPAPSHAAGGWRRNPARPAGWR